MTAADRLFGRERVDSIRVEVPNTYTPEEAMISIERVLNETKGGKTYTDQSPESFADVAKEYLENRDKILLDGLNGYNSVIERYNLEFEKTEIIKAYQKLGLC